jgi:hypothetical protein
VLVRLECHLLRPKVVRCKISAGRDEFMRNSEKNLMIMKCQPCEIKLAS